MANVFIKDSTMSAIGDAIRAKTGGTAKILPADMATEIAAIETGSDIQLIEGMEIPLDFSAGDQSLAAPDGQAVKTATIKKPTTLVPQNIANGVNVAGVVGTLESGGGSSGGAAVGLKNIASINLTGSTSSASVPIQPSIEVPAEATNIFVWQDELMVQVRNSSYSYINEDYVRLPTKMYGEEDMTITDNGNGYKTIKFSLPTFAALSGGAMYSITKVNYPSLVGYTMPNITLEDNILYMGADCVRPCHYAGSSARHIFSYVEGIDMRGSKITEIQWGQLCRMTELKKVWLSEATTTLGGYSIGYNTGLEELHFTSATPPSMYSKDVYVNMPTTCKIYVPAGKLSAYTSAEYYPDPAKYTYIEE